MGNEFWKGNTQKKRTVLLGFLDPTIAGWYSNPENWKAFQHFFTIATLVDALSVGYYNLDKLSDNTLVQYCLQCGIGFEMVSTMPLHWTWRLFLISDKSFQIPKGTRTYPLMKYFLKKIDSFTEGTELFNKGNLFYSRRVGAQSSTTIDESQLASDEFITGYHTGNLIKCHQNFRKNI